MFLVVFTNSGESLEECLVNLSRPLWAERFFFLSTFENIFSDTDPPVKTPPRSRAFIVILLVQII